MSERPSIDHSLLSPSGRVSRRARQAALKREHDRLFPPGYWDAAPKTEAEAKRERSAKPSARPKVQNDRLRGELGAGNSRARPCPPSPRLEAPRAREGDRKHARLAKHLASSVRHR